MDGVDDNPRPLKRHRSSPSASGSNVVEKCFNPIAPASLLLSVPSLVLHPPSHRHHSQSVALAQHSLRRCLKIGGLDQILECRAWTGLAELGIGALFSGHHEYMGEVEKALTKALLVAQKHPSLRLYVPRITQLSAQLAHVQKNTRFAQHSIRRLISSLSTDSAHLVASARLSLIHSLSIDAESATPLWPSESNPALAKCLRAVQDLHDLSNSSGIRNASTDKSHSNSLKLLSHVLRLQLLVRHGVWSQTADALSAAEADFESYPTTSALNHATSSFRSIESAPQSPTPATDAKPSALPSHLRIHLLILAVHIHNYFGDAPAAAERLRLLHTLIDEGALTQPNDLPGVCKLSLAHPEASNEGPAAKYLRPLYLKTTHPRIIYILTFLLSAGTKRDAAGRKPRKAIFAREGLAVLDRELGFESVDAVQGTGASGKEKEIILPSYAPLSEMVDIRIRMVKMKADLLCEIVNVSIMRSEFKEAEQALNELIAHTRTYDLFPTYAARITLQQGQFAHSLGQTERALQCYDLAAWLSEGHHCDSQDSKRKGTENNLRDDWVRVAARAGRLWVRIGILRKTNANTYPYEPGTGRQDAEGDAEMSDLCGDDTRVGSSPRSGGRGVDVELQELRRAGKEVIEECKGMGGILAAIGEILAACLHVEFWGAKQHLRRALDLATKAQDNHLRALILALSASHYLHTARDNALVMLGTCEQIAAGLGAVSKKAVTGNEDTKNDVASEHVGNAQMRLWVGERTLELHRWAGDTQKSARQAAINKRLTEVVHGIEKGPAKRTLHHISA